MVHGFWRNTRQQAGPNFSIVRSIMHRVQWIKVKWTYHRIRFHLQLRKTSKPMRVTSGQIILIRLLPSNQDASLFPPLRIPRHVTTWRTGWEGGQSKVRKSYVPDFPLDISFIIDSSLCRWSLSEIPRCLTKGLCLCYMAAYDTERCDRQWIPLHRWRATILTWKVEDRINTLIGRASALFLIQQWLTWSNILKIIKQRRMEDRTHFTHFKWWNINTHFSGMP
jgi:hypothetical protein